MDSGGDAMPLWVTIIGWLIALEGVFFLVKPEALNSMIRFFIKGRRLYLLSVLRIILAVVFFIAARQCRQPAVIIVLGVILLAAGIGGFVMRLSTTKTMLKWWLEKPNMMIRLLGLISLAVGMMIVYSAK